MQPPLKFYYTINAELINDFYTKNLLINQQINLNIFIDNAEVINEFFFRALSDLKNNYIFSISSALLKSTNFFQQILSEIYLLLSLNIEAQQIIMPVFIKNSDENLIENISSVISYLNKQGIEEISIPAVYCKKEIIQYNQECCFIFFSSTKENDLINAFNKNGHTISSITIVNFEQEISDLDIFLETINNFNSLQKNFFNFSPDFFSTYFVEKKLYEQEEKRWNKRVTLYKDFLSLSKTVQEKEYYDVLNWYHNEYEILPLWYKQFGHILKVLMGKRSFRSLFNDNVKKYKD